jgi:hypothetical protein
VLLLLGAAFTPGLLPAQEKQEQAAAIVIVNAQVSDGSDAPLKKASVRIVQRIMRAHGREQPR